MLIDTKNIINLTDLRQTLGQVIDEVELGRIKYISKKGKIKAIIAPSSFVQETVDRSEIFKRLKILQRKIDKQLRGKKKIWKSEEVVRKMRDERTKKLLSYL